MVLGTKKRIQEMEYAGKADSSVADKYGKLEKKHSIAIMEKDKKYDAIIVEKEKLENCKAIAASISIFHPIKKHKAKQQVRLAEKEVRRAENEYKAARQNLKDAQKKLRAMRREIREQHRAMKENEKMIKRMQRIMTDKQITPSLMCSTNYATQSHAYSGQVYHIDPNPAKNTRMQTPNSILIAEVNKVYKANVQKKWKNRGVKIMKDVRGVARDVYHRTTKVLGSLADSRRTISPEMEI